jgi:acylphosphatase
MSTCALVAGFRFTVHGKVQGRSGGFNISNVGVFFRKHTQSKATSLGLVGFVRNARDGTVVGEAQGEPAKLDTLCALWHIPLTQAGKGGYKILVLLPPA